MFVFRYRRCIPPPPRNYLDEPFPRCQARLNFSTFRLGVPSVALPSECIAQSEGRTVPSENGPLAVTYVAHVVHVAYVALV